MQMIERPWGVAAYGAASVKARPDMMRSRFKVARLEQTPSEAFAAATEAVHRVREVLRAHGIPDGAVDRSRLNLSTRWVFPNSVRTFVGFECEAAFTVESADLDDVQALLVDVVAAGAHEIESVEFDVRAKPELRAEARRKAVAAARAKAELYAEAAGVRLGAVVHIDDVDPEQPGVDRYRGHGSSVGTADAELAPGHVVVSAAVILGFALVRDEPKSPA
jgi:hypothetical protein